MKVCVDCGSPEIHERKRCRSCALLYNRERAKRMYRKNKEDGVSKKRYGIMKCEYCGENMIKNNSTQYMHKECYNAHIKKVDYNSYKRDKDGKTIGRNTFLTYCELPSDWVVHHIDENPMNNDISNLIGLSRKDHVQLHSFLSRIRSSYEKSYGSMDENCWKPLRDKETKTWLEMANVNVIKISCIGQSAAKAPENGEGSETKRILPETDNAVG